MSVGSPDHVLGRAQHAGNIVNRYTKLQEQGCTSMAKDMRGDFRAEPRQFPSGTPRASLLGLNGAPSVFDGILGCEPAPTAEVRCQARRDWYGRPTFARFHRCGRFPVNHSRIQIDPTALRIRGPLQSQNRVVPEELTSNLRRHLKDQNAAVVRPDKNGSVGSG